jgi:AcrR family transcriptional regulator
MRPNDKRPTPETRILDAARKRFETLGYRAAGVAQIARDAGVAAGTIYRYFPNKEAILFRVVADINGEWLRVARTTLAEPGSPIDRIARMGEASIEFNRLNPILNAVLERDDEIVFAPLLDELYTEVMRENVAMIEAVIREGIEEGSLVEIDPKKAALVLFAAGRASASLPDYPYGEILPVLMKIASDGLLPR